jgi:hypothetical protein
MDRGKTRACGSRYTGGKPMPLASELGLLGGWMGERKYIGGGEAGQ